MSRAPAGKLRLWIGQPVNAPFVTPPIGLRAILIVCVLSVTGAMVVGVVRQLSAGGTPEMSALEMALIAGFYFVVPVLIAVTIATNRTPSRVLILAYSGFCAYQIILYVETISTTPEKRAYIVAAIGVALLAMVWWLFKNARMRIYYALISGKSIPNDLNDRVDELTSPGRFEAAFGRLGNVVGPYTEIAVVILIIASVLIAWASMKYQ